MLQPPSAPGFIAAGRFNDQLVQEFEVRVAGWRFRKRRIDSFWTIKNADGTAIPLGTAFSVKIDGKSSSVHLATTANSSQERTFINHLSANGNPHATVMVTRSITLKNHHLGVGYDNPSNRWFVFNQDGAAMESGARFNYKVLGKANATLNAFTTHGNVANNWMNIAPWTSASSTVLATPNRNATSFNNDHPIGIWWTGGNWAVYNDDSAQMSDQAAFNVWRVQNEL